MKSNELLGELVVLMAYCATADVEYLASNECANRFKDILETVKEYKKIEEDLGIDLVTLFKALKNGFYTIREDLGLITDARLVLNHTYPKFEFIRDNSMYFYSLKDYGETWALTKEELEEK